jgi:prepilin-type N-terminal cleavage/methylation domain-containing protein/prepilin-type processing-associated H-X9-DG protein
MIENKLCCYGKENDIMRKIKGFTLVELLVVVSIIALLLAIMIPAMRRAKEQANSIVCKSNLRSYGLAGAMYLQANNNAFPHPIICVDGSDTFMPEYLAIHPKSCRWHDTGVVPKGPFWPYLAEQGVHICPTFAAISRTRGVNHPEHDTVLNIPINPRNTYSMNGFLGAGGQVGNRYEDLVALPGHGSLQMVKLTDVKCPYETLFATEENIWTITKSKDGVNVSNCALNDMFFGPDRYGNGDCIATFHRAGDSKLNTGFSNVLFIDGHVDERKAYDQDDLKLRYSGKSYYLALGIGN